MAEVYVLIVLFLFGSIVGSFLNVCIVRIPEKLSIVMPPSHCPTCKKPIAFYDNIPLLSYIIYIAVVVVIIFFLPKVDDGINYQGE